MGCKQDRPKVKPKPGRYQCGKCGTVAKKSKHICQAKKIKEDGGKKD